MAAAGKSWRVPRRNVTDTSMKQGCAWSFFVGETMFGYTCDDRLQGQIACSVWKTEARRCSVFLPFRTGRCPLTSSG